MTTCDWVVWAILVLAATVIFLNLKCNPPNSDPRPTYPPSPLETGERQAHWVEFLKLEYDKAADRYENIYRAIWQNFSYMAVVAGGILAFGAQELGVGPNLFFLAITPLFFWLVATFLPLNHYGQAIRNRLKEIENDINRFYFSGDSDPRLEHFKLFGVTRYRWRVQTAVGVFGVGISMSWLLFGVLWVSKVIRNQGAPGVVTKTLHLQADPLRIEVQEPDFSALRDSISVVSARVTSIDSILQIRAKPVHRPGSPGGSTHQ